MITLRLFWQAKKPELSGRTHRLLSMMTRETISLSIIDSWLGLARQRVEILSEASQLGDAKKTKQRTRRPSPVSPPARSQAELDIRPLAAIFFYLAYGTHMLQLFPAREIALALGNFEIHWYGVLYIAGFALAWWLLPKLQKYRGLALTRDQWLELITWCALGVIAGGRLGYVLFYEPAFFLSNPGQMIAIWDGGMSSHGGFIGVAIALGLVARHFKIELLALLDVIVVPVALGLALGRVGNFINQELYLSTAAHLAAIGKNLLISALCFLSLKSGWHRGVRPEILRNSEGPHAKHGGSGTVAKSSGESPVTGPAPGQTLALFLILYAILRFLTEYWRVQEFSGAFGLTRGQLLTLPVLLAGVMLWIWLRREPSSSKHSTSATSS